MYRKTTYLELILTSFYFGGRLPLHITSSDTADLDCQWVVIFSGTVSTNQLNSRPTTGLHLYADIGKFLMQNSHNYSV